MRDIPGWEGLYAITREGKVWSYPKGKGAFKEGRFLKGTVGVRGYFVIALYKPGEWRIRVRTRTIHQLVGITYLPNPKRLPQINHKNGIKTDNRVENLEWCTSKENVDHAVRTGLFRPNPSLGEQHYNSKLTAKDVGGIRKMRKQGKILKEIAAHFGVSLQAVASIVYRYNWKHLP